MLINVFGVWLVAANIVFMQPGTFGAKCAVHFFHAKGPAIFVSHTCDEVAAEINKQTKETDEGEVMTLDNIIARLYSEELEKELERVRRERQKKTDEIVRRMK